MAETPCQLIQLHCNVTLLNCKYIVVCPIYLLFTLSCPIPCQRTMKGRTACTRLVSKIEQYLGTAASIRRFNHTCVTPHIMSPTLTYQFSISDLLGAGMRIWRWRRHFCPARFPQLHRLFKAPPDPQLTLPLYQQLRICSDRVFLMPAIFWTSLFLLCARQQARTFLSSRASHHAVSI